MPTSSSSATTHVDLPALLAALRETGQARILTEGGPSLLGAFAADDLIDEVVATITPCPGRW